MFHRIGSTDLFHPPPAPQFKLSRCFPSTLRSVHVTAPYKSMLQMWHFTSSFLKFISVPSHLPTSESQSIMPGSIISSFASNTSPSAYYTVQITFPPILKSPNIPRPSSVSYLVYKLNTIGDKRHPSLTPLPVFTLLVYPWSSRTLTLCSM